MTRNFYWRYLSKKIPAFIRKFKNPKHIFFTILSFAILSWGIVYTNCGSSLDVSENSPEDLNVLNDPSCLQNSGGSKSCILQIATGAEFSCALLSSGKVKCWGINQAGQLGNGTIANSNLSTDVVGLTSVTSIAAGNNHACAVLSNGNVKCWGFNQFGQLGNGTTSTGPNPNPVSVNNLSGAIAVDAGWGHTCALVTGGMVKCWGHNADGALGNGNFISTTAPNLSVSGIANATAISSGLGHVCALISGGSVKCWGLNSSGELGNNSTVNSNVPVGVSSLMGITKIKMGGRYSCSIGPNGAVKCWGNNQSGQLGNNSTIMSKVPVSSGVTGAIAITAGQGDMNYHTCAILSGGTAKCWGNNQNGQLGNNSTTNSYVPVAVTVASNITAIETGLMHTCAIIGGKQIRCWGLNSSGELGNGSNTNSLTAQSVKTIGCASVQQVTSGEFHTCALLNTGEVYCWGWNYWGQLGDNTTTDQWIPTQVHGPNNTGFLSGVVQIEAGDENTCALLNTGEVYCWGWNAWGQIGDGTNSMRMTPTQVHGVSNVGFLSGVAEIAVGDEYNCARLNTGGVDCWGRNSNGELGDNTNINRLTPVQVHGLSNVGFLSGSTGINAGPTHACSVNNGNMYCWGTNSNGELGDNTNTMRMVPTQVHGVANVGFLSAVAAVETGDHYTCALLNSGNVNCWGLNSSGQLGDNTNIDRWTPVQVHGVSNVGVLSGVTSITTSYTHTCSILSSGGMNCWGLNIAGQLGDNTNTNRLTPVQVHGISNVGFLSGVNQIDAGNLNTCSVLSTGYVYCWGSNFKGQIGDSTNVDKHVPTQVLGIP